MIKENFERVKEILTKYPEMRDSDNKLMAHIWREDLGYKLNVMSAQELLVNLASKHDLSSWGSITRTSRKVQELHSELRGKNYIDRHKKEIEVIEEVKEIKSSFDEKFGYKPLPKEGLFQ